MCDVLRGFDVSPGARPGNLRLKLAGSERYIRILRDAFPSARWIGPLERVFDSRFDHVLFVDQLEQEGLERFLNFARETLLCQSSLDELWALEWHMGQAGRSAVGELVYSAKTYSEFHKGDVGSAAQLGSLLVERFGNHPTIREADVVVGVPAFPPREPYNLPELLAEVLATELRIRFRGDVLFKTRGTNVKNLENEEKLDALHGVYEVRRSLDGLSVVVVDDLLRSGSTLGVIGGELRAAGASKVLGIVATKTLRN